MASAVIKRDAVAEYLFAPNERLFIELNDGTMYRGNYEGGTTDRIDINNAVLYPRKNCDVINEVISFYRSEIRSVRRFMCKTESKQPLQTQPIHRIIEMTETRFDYLFSLAITFDYVMYTNTKYHSIVHYLREQTTIGVAGLGRKYIIATGLNYLVVSTPQVMFIFDLYTLTRPRNDIPKEIKEILEMDSIEKVVCGASVLNFSFKKTFKTKIVNVFDIKVADVLLQNYVTGKKHHQLRSLSTCLSDYFNFPYLLVENDSLSLDWEVQPLTDFLKVRASLIVGYLIPLKRRMEQILMKIYKKEVTSHANTYVENITAIS